MANANVKKAHMKQCKAYNSHNSKGTKFQIGQKILKINVQDKQRTQKMAPRMLGPYTIVSISENGNLWLKDHFSHEMKKSMHPSQVVEYFENPKKKLLSDSRLDSSGKSEESLFENLGCQRAQDYQPKKVDVPLTLTPIKSQIVIMSSCEMPVSSDESETIDVVNDRINDRNINPWGDIPVDDIPIEIVDNLHNDTDGDSSCDLIDVQTPPPMVFNPLMDEEGKLAGVKFFLVLNPSDHALKYSGISKVFHNEPVVTISAKLDGYFLLNTFSILLAGRETYSTVIWHAICQYISSPVNEPKIKPYIPCQYKNGNDYVKCTNMHYFTTWGTEVEIVAFAQMTSHDVIVFTEQKNWAGYSHGSDHSICSTNSFYVSNVKGYHFDPILQA